MVIALAAATVGAYTLETTITQLNKSAVAITKGDVLYYDPADDFFKQAPAAGVSTQYAVAVDAAAAADTKVRAARYGPVTVKNGGGTLAVGCALKVDGTTAGRVMEGVQTAVADINAIVGHYMGKADNNERDGLAIAAASSGDVVWMFLKGGEA